MSKSKQLLAELQEVGRAPKENELVVCKRALSEEWIGRLSRVSARLLPNVGVRLSAKLNDFGPRVSCRLQPGVRWSTMYSDGPWSPLIVSKATPADIKNVRDRQRAQKLRTLVINALPNCDLETMKRVAFLMKLESDDEQK